MKIKQYIRLFTAALFIIPVLCSCDSQEQPGNNDIVPDGMVEIRPVLSGLFSSIPRDPSDIDAINSRSYDSTAETESKLENNPKLRLPMGSTVWLIAKHVSGTETTYTKKSFVVYNPSGNSAMSYLVPCTVDDNGEMLTMEGSPLYLKRGETYNFYVVSPARKIELEDGKYGFKIKNGEYVYSTDCRYTYTSPGSVLIDNNNSGNVQVVELNPMINQTALLKFQISGGFGVHDLGIQPSGIHISGLQNDSPTNSQFGDANGIKWHISQNENDEPITLQHGDKTGTLNCHDYTVDAAGNINIEVPILPMYSISKPVIVLFRIKVNGVPTSYEVMLNEKDFKAGYSYGYRGSVAIEEGIDVITWQYVGWITETPLPAGQ